MTLCIKCGKYEAKQGNSWCRYCLQLLSLIAQSNDLPEDELRN